MHRQLFPGLFSSDGRGGFVLLLSENQKLRLPSLCRTQIPTGRRCVASNRPLSPVGIRVRTRKTCFVLSLCLLKSSFPGEREDRRCHLYAQSAEESNSPPSPATAKAAVVEHDMQLTGQNCLFPLRCSLSCIRVEIYCGTFFVVLLSPWPDAVRAVVVDP